MKRLHIQLKVFLIILLSFQLKGQGSNSGKFLFELHNESISSALMKLSNMNKTRIAFSNSRLKSDIKISIERREDTTMGFLKEILGKSNLSFTIISNHIVVYPNPKPDRISMKY